jgi:hypothetical protein
MVHEPLEETVGATDVIRLTVSIKDVDTCTAKGAFVDSPQSPQPALLGPDRNASLNLGHSVQLCTDLPRLMMQCCFRIKLH